MGKVNVDIILVILFILAIGISALCFPIGENKRGRESKKAFSLLKKRKRKKKLERHFHKMTYLLFYFFILRIISNLINFYWVLALFIILF